MGYFHAGILGTQRLDHDTQGMFASLQGWDVDTTGVAPLDAIQCLGSDIRQLVVVDKDLQGAIRSLFGKSIIEAQAIGCP